MYSKWYHYQVLKRAPSLASSLPRTKRMKKEVFKDFIDKYHQVIIKPVRGSGGAGVMKVSFKGKKRYEIHDGKNKKVIKGVTKTYRFIKERIRGRAYIVQRHIPLAKVDERPFDVRVMVQRLELSPWKVTGILAKVAGKGYFITNVARSKGMVLPVKTAIKKSNIKNQSPESILHKIRKLVFKATKQLKPGLGQKILGYDIGLDKDGNPWFIEVNTRPALTLFLKLKDRRMYRIIMWYKNREKKRRTKPPA